MCPSAVYGMLGLMTALPTTPDFITYEAVYLPKNYFIKEENISTERYLSYFFPFDKIDFRKKGIESSWSTGSPEMMALIMTMKNKPQAVMMFSFMLTDDNSRLKVCKHCGKAFAATRSNMEFCSPQCKNQYNVYKSRAKKNNDSSLE